MNRSVRTHGDHGAAPGAVAALLRACAIGAAALVAAVVLALGTASVAAAQDEGGESEVRYQEALADYETLREELERSLNRFERALDVVDRARESGGSGQEEAFASFQTVAVQHMALELETEQALGRVNQARAAYLQMLQQREGELLDALADPDLSPERGAAIEESWQEIRREMLALEPADELEATIAIRPVPELRVEPTDGPTELREKAGFMEVHALSYDSIIGDLDREIESLEERERRLRGLQDFQRDLDRFGQDLLVGAGRGSPGVPDPERSGDGGEVGDGAEGGPASALAQLPLSERIELLRGTRELAERYRDEALAMAEVFRERAERFGR